MTIDMLSIGIKFENFMQAGDRDLGLHCGRTLHCQKPIILPKLVPFFGTFLELPVLPSIIRDAIVISQVPKKHLGKTYHNIRFLRVI